MEPTVLRKRQIEQVFQVTIVDFETSMVTQFLDDNYHGLKQGYPLFLVGMRPRIRIIDIESQPRTWQLTFRSHAGIVSTIQHKKADHSFNHLEVSGDGGVVTALLRGREIASGLSSILYVAFQDSVSLKSSNEREQRFDESFLDLEILYVGRTEDARWVNENESTTQYALSQILADAHIHHPEKELVVVRVDPEIFTTKTALPDQDGDGQTDHVQRYESMEPVLDEHTKIAVAEAALIRAFEPEYNQRVATKFSNETQTNQEKIQPFESNPISLLIETHHRLGFRLYSGTVDPAFIIAKNWSVRHRPQSFSSEH